MNVCRDGVFRIVEQFVTKLGMVMQHHEAECLGHSEGSYDQNMTIATVAVALLILLLPNLV